jgi:tetratricopeptide (TPR) repeat protein
MASRGEIDRVSAPRRWKGIVLLARRLVRRPSPRPKDVALDAFNRGVALSAMGERDAAVAAYETSMASCDRDIAARAAFNLGALCPDDLEVAISAYLSAIATEHPDVAPKAAFNLGSLLAARGDLEGATGMLRRALHSGDEDVSARSALKLESLRAGALIDRWMPSRAPARPSGPKAALGSASSRRRRGRPGWDPSRSRQRGSSH